MPKHRLKQFHDPVPEIEEKSTYHQIVEAFASYAITKQELQEMKDEKVLHYVQDRVYDVLVTFTKKFAKGSVCKVNHRKSEDIDLVKVKYYPFLQRVKRFCQENFHATAPFFDPQPIEFTVNHVTNHYYDEIWHVIPETNDLPEFSRLHGLHMVSYAGWLQTDPDDERYELLRVIEQQQAELNYYRKHMPPIYRRDCTL